MSPSCFLCHSCCKDSASLGFCLHSPPTLRAHPEWCHSPVWLSFLITVRSALYCPGSDLTGVLQVHLTYCVSMNSSLGLIYRFSPCSLISSSASWCLPLSSLLVLLPVFFFFHISWCHHLQFTLKILSHPKCSPAMPFEANHGLTSLVVQFVRTIETWEFFFLDLYAISDQHRHVLCHTLSCLCHILSHILCRALEITTDK